MENNSIKKNIPLQPPNTTRKEPFTNQDLHEQKRAMEAMEWMKVINCIMVHEKRKTEF